MMEGWMIGRFFLLPVSRSRIRTRIGRFFIIHRDRWSLLSSGAAEYLGTTGPLAPG